MLIGYVPITPYVNLCKLSLSIKGRNRAFLLEILRENLVGNSEGNSVGNLAGNLAGNLVGNSAGNLAGNSVENLGGNSAENLVGNLVGNSPYLSPSHF